MSLVIHLFANSVAIYLAAEFVPNISFTGDVKVLLVTGLVIGFINFFIKPVLKLITFPLLLFSLGFFAVVINMFLLWLVDYFVPELAITGILALFWGTVIISAVNIVASILTHK